MPIENLEELKEEFNNKFLDYLPQISQSDINNLVQQGRLPGLLGQVQDFTTNQFYFVAGGCFPRLINDLPNRDVDIFVHGKQLFDYIINLYKNDFNFEFLEDLSYDNNLAKFKHHSGLEIDVVHLHQSMTPTMFVEMFDFTVSRFAAQYDDFSQEFEILTIDNNDFIDVKNRTLRFTGRLLFGTRGNNTITRLLKYVKLGFQITEEDYREISYRIHDITQKGINAGAIQPKEIGAHKYY